MPLVLTAIPRVFRPIERSPELGTTIGGRGFAVRLVHQGPRTRELAWVERGVVYSLGSG